MLSEVFWTFVVSSVAGCMLATLRMAYKSKCKKFSFCGLAIERDTDEETQIDLAPPPSPIPRSDSLMLRV
jgi:hypothetical protein